MSATKILYPGFVIEPEWWVGATPLLLSESRVEKLHKDQAVGRNPRIWTNDQEWKEG